MRGLAIAFLAVAALSVIWFLASDQSEQFYRWITHRQRDIQNAMASSLRALRSGEPGALATLWSLCLTYGFVHAAGPGHGKLVIGGYGVATRVPTKRLIALAVSSSLAQALTAIALVATALWFLDWGRERMTHVADRIMAPLSYGMIASIGAYLVYRGLRKLWRNPQDSNDHNHDGTGVCGTCGHAHGPTVEQATQVRSLRDAIAIITSIAIRPCTGALFLLILTNALGIFWAGVVGALIMGLGTAAFTGLVAVMAVGLRESSLMQVATGHGAARVMAVVEVLVGGVVMALAVQMFLRISV